jgi:hypothetical protein
MDVVKIIEKNPTQRGTDRPLSEVKIVECGELK